MTDYNKNTVVQIKDIFKERGIPTTGLTRKQQLIDRLLEHDAETAEEQEAPGADAEEGGDATEEQPAVAEVATQAQPAAEAPSEPRIAEVAQSIQPVDNATGPDGQSSESAAVNDASREEVEAAADEAVPDALSTDDAGQPPSITGDTTTKQDLPPLDVAAHKAEMAAKEAEAARPPPALRPGSGEDMTPSEPVAAPSSPTSGDRKRKRRSATPSVDPEEVANKKAKQDEAGVAPTVILKEDLDTSDRKPPASVPDVEAAVEDIKEEIPPPVMQAAADESKAGEVQAQVEAAAANVPAPLAQAAAEEAIAGKLPKSALEVPAASDSIHEATGLSLDSPAAPTKLPQGRDGRFKDLLSPMTQDAPQDMELKPDADDRTVSPATHPATNALYIRELMRPLKDPALKSHLASLARPPSEANRPLTDADESAMVTTFYLDTIKTHCLATFQSVTAASRVRNSLHDRVWPPEGNRKPLWVDFIPEEKVQQWIETEQQQGGSRASTSKRWEVAYDQADDGSVTAHLQDAIAGGGPPRRPTADTLPTPADPTPTGPRGTVTSNIEPPKVSTSKPTSTAPAPTPAGAPTEQFQALDTLFKSTIAKPKLYYLPVSKSLVDKRLDELDARTSRRAQLPLNGSGHADSTRFTFEEGDLLVDNGPEFGLRSVVGRRGGRGGGGFRGRGGHGGGGGY